MNPSKILRWNVRGLNSRSHQDSLHTLVNSCKVDVVCLQETKMTQLSRGSLLSMLGSDVSFWVDLPATGASGGILVAWRHELGMASVTRVDRHSVSIQFSPNNTPSWWLTCVYGPQQNDDKLLFLQELRGLWAACSSPWLILGDFNIIAREEDKNNGILNRAMMGRFRRLINDL